MIINPKTANWITTWSALINFCLLYGYIVDPFYIAFYIAEERWSNKPDIAKRPPQNMTLKVFVDFILAIDIIFKCLTTF